MAKKNKTAAPAKESGKKLSRKERKQQKKALLKSRLELEKQLVAEGKIPARNRYRSNNFFWRVFALCLVFVFGMFAIVGAFFGFGAFAPVKDFLWLTGIDYSNIVYEEYAKLSLLDIVRDVMSNSFDSIASISKYSPVIDNYLNTFDESLSALGVHLDKDKVKNTTFSELGGYFRDEVLGSIVLGEALGLTANENNRLMVALCYGREGIDYTADAEGKITPINPPVTVGDLTNDSASLIDRVTVEDALGVSAASNAAMRFLAYGTEGINYEIDSGEIVMLENELTGKLYEKKTLSALTSDGATPIENAKISDLITVESETGILAAIKDWSIADLKDSYRIERLKIGQVMDLGSSASKLAQALADRRLSDLTDPALMDTLTLGEILEIGEDSPPILRALEETPVGELGSAVDGLRLTDLLKDEDFEGNNFLAPLKHSSLTSLAADLKKLSAADLFGDRMYEYLDLAKSGNKSYREIYEAYKTTGRKEAEASAKVPSSSYNMELADGDTVRSYFEHEGTRLREGFYLQKAEGGYEAVPEENVYKRTGPEEAVTYSIKGEQTLTEHREWRLVDYDAKTLAPLPEGDEISAETEGCTVVEREGTPYTVEGQPYYYLTTRIVFADGAPTEETERVAYPIMQNDYGPYYSYLKYTESGGADEFREVRVDLEYALVSLSYEDGEGTVTLEKNGDGKWQTSPEEGEPVVVPVYEHKAVTDPDSGEVTEPASYFRKTETEVHLGYYAESGDITEVFDKNAVTAKFEIVKEDGSAVETERYLSGVWFFLFGVDEKDNFVDNTDSPVLDLTTVMSGMSDTLSHTELWKLYFHGLLTSNPFVDLSGKFPGGVSVGKDENVTNLNECTVAETVTLVRAILGS